MSSKTIFKVSGIPRPQPRPRVFRGRAISTLDKNAQEWRRCISHVAHNLAVGGVKFSTPIVVDLEFLFPTDREDRHGRPHVFVPDADNLAKLVLDVCQDAGIVTNDSLVHKLTISKVWCGIGSEGVIVTIESEA